VGYGGAYQAAGELTIGVVACGYADGYPRHAPTGTPVLVNGRRSRTVGRVSMDMITVDLTGIPGAGVGTPVTLWGEGLSADEVAAAAGTLSYELLTKVTARVPFTHG
jgi:alanine racemase